MELKPGYKQTEVGLIPEDWAARSIQSLADFTNGKPYEGKVQPNGRYFLITLDSIGIDGQLKAEHRTIDSLDGSLAKDDIVVILSDLAHGNLLGLCDLIPTDGRYVLNQRVGRLRLKIPASPQYVRLQINRHQDHFRKRGQGTSQRHIYRRDIDALVIPFPDATEQRAIAAALSDVDALLAKLDALIAKKRDIKHAAMQQLLSGARRLPEFSGEWEVKRLGDIGTFSKGRGIRKDEVVSDGIPCIRYGEIYTHHNDYIRRFYSAIPRHVAEQSQRLRKGDLLFAGSGETAEEIGKCVAFLGDEEAYAGGDIVIFTPINQYSMYLGYLMNYSTISSQKAKLGQGDAVVHISATNLAQLQLLLPFRPEQMAIAEVLSDMDAEIAALEARREKTRALKQGMMQELLTGRIRLLEPSTPQAVAAP